MSAAVIIALAVIGIVLLAVEIFIIPGFGISGILGIGALIAAIVAAADSPGEVILFSAGTLVIVAGLIYLGFKGGYLEKSVFLTTRLASKDGYVAPKSNLSGHIGRTGTAMTPLRPAGTADFQGERLDVVSEGDFIPKGAAIRVIAVEGVRIIVREVPSER